MQLINFCKSIRIIQYKTKVLKLKTVVLKLARFCFDGYNMFASQS